MEGLIRREEKETDLEIHSVVHFWMVWKEKNRLTFKGGRVLAIQKFKNSFVCNLWCWTILYIREESLSLIGFLEWLASS